MDGLTTAMLLVMFRPALVSSTPIAGKSNSNGGSPIYSPSFTTVKATPNLRRLPMTFSGNGSAST